MKKLLIICGPTATGKTSLGILLAKKFNGEIISADSRQIYKGMNVGTGKDLTENLKLKIVLRQAQDNAERSRSIDCKLKIKNLDIGYYKVGGIKVWLYDICQPDCQFNVANFIDCAQVVINDIWRREKLPILVGGTGFYLKVLVEGIGSLGIEPDRKLRKQLDSWSVSQLGSHLRKIGLVKWEKMNESDRKNPRRLIRAIEIALAHQEQRAKSKEQSLRREAIWLGLRVPFKDLYQRIDKRVEKRVEQGFEKEIKNLLKKGYNWENSILGETIGYKEWRPFLEGKNSLSGTIQKWKFSEHAYARRQMTWFKKQPGIHWFDISQKNWQVAVERLVKQWYNSDKPDQPN